MNRSKLKERLRGELLEKRRSIAFEEVFSLSQKIQKRFLGSPFYERSEKIALYSGFRNEVLTDEIFQRAMDDGKEVFFPSMAKGGRRRLVFRKVTDLKELTPGSYEILEPEAGVAVDTASLDLVVVPGAAFDAAGARLGYGKGYYDIALAGAECAIVALAYEFQVLKEAIPVEPHDVKVTAIVTEKRLIRV